MATVTLDYKDGCVYLECSPHFDRQADMHACRLHPVSRLFERWQLQ